MTEDINVLFWSIMIYSGMQYLVITLSMGISPISSDLAWYICHKHEIWVKEKNEEVWMHL